MDKKVKHEALLQTGSTKVTIEPNTAHQAKNMFIGMFFFIDRYLQNLKPTNLPNQQNTNKIPTKSETRRWPPKLPGLPRERTMQAQRYVGWLIGLGWLVRGWFGLVGLIWFDLDSYWCVVLFLLLVCSCSATV